MKNFEIKNQNGRSMIEMLGVLAIIGVLSVGGIAGYSKAMHKYRVNKTIEQITLIAGNIRSFFKGDYTDLGRDGCDGDTICSKIVKKAKLLPDEMLGDSYYPKFANGSPLLLYSSNKNTNNDSNAFEMQLDNISQTECIDITTIDWSYANVGAIYFDEAGIILKTPIDINDAIKYCPRANSQINFYFDIDANSTYWKKLFDDDTPRDSYNG